MAITDGPRGERLRLKRADDLPEHPTPRAVPAEVYTEEVLDRFTSVPQPTRKEHDASRQREHGWIK